MKPCDNFSIARSQVVTRICKDFHDLPPSDSALSVILPPMELWRHGMNPLLTLLHSKASMATGHICQVWVFLCFSAQAVPRARNVPPPCTLPLPSYGLYTQEVTLKTLVIISCFLDKEMPTGASCLDHYDARRRSEVSLLGRVCRGRWQLWHYLPRDDHGLLACKKPGTLLSIFSFLHFQELFSLLCPNCP